MKPCILFLALFFIPFFSFGQRKNQHFVSDNNKKFSYSDSAGGTQSYISYFGNTFTTPDLTTIDGKTIAQSELKGKIVFYNFWFVACKPCVAEIPALNRLAAKYHSDSIQFIAISFDSESRIRDFLQKRKFDFQIASLPQNEIDSIKKISFYPFTAIVNKEGILTFALFSRPVGKNPEQELFDLLDKQIIKAIAQ